MFFFERLDDRTTTPQKEKNESHKLFPGRSISSFETPLQSLFCTDESHRVFCSSSWSLIGSAVFRLKELVAFGFSFVSTSTSTSKKKPSQFSRRRRPARLPLRPRPRRRAPQGRRQARARARQVRQLVRRRQGHRGDPGDPSPPVREEQEEFLVFPFSPDVFLFFARSTSRPPLRSFSFSDSSPSSSFPFLLVDRVVELVPQKYAVGYKVRATFSPPRKWRERERERTRRKRNGGA